MKLQSLYDALNEGKFSKSTYAYHATQGDYLKSILKHGLVPNKQDSGYGSDLASSIGYSMKSLPGTYFTKNANKAKYITDDIQKNGQKTPPIIVIAKIQLETAELDEDNLTSYFLDEKDFIKNLSIQKSPERRNFTIEAHVEKVVGRLAHSTNINDKVKNNIFQPLMNYFTELANFTSGDGESEVELRNHKNVLTKKLKNLLKMDETGSQSFKISEPVTFSGANRIVGFYCPETRLGWGDVADFSPYHIVNNPMSILKVNEY